MEPKPRYPEGVAGFSNQRSLRLYAGVLIACPAENKLHPGQTMLTGVEIDPQHSTLEPWLRASPAVDFYYCRKFVSSPLDAKAYTLGGCSRPFYSGKPLFLAAAFPSPSSEVLLLPVDVKLVARFGDSL